MAEPRNLREEAVDYIKRWIGVPYAWGGDDPMRGFDCSGLIHEVLQAVGLEPHGVDSTAHDLYLKYRLRKVLPEEDKRGCLVFWFRSGKAIHVEMMVDQDHSVGASGGGRRVRSISDAIQANAFVKMRPVTYRGEHYKIVDPFREESP